jgi:hypothetical protein
MVTLPGASSNCTAAATAVNGAIIAAKPQLEGLLLLLSCAY